jgi:hypothetical protein
LKLAIGQRGLWDSAIAEIGVGAGIFQKHNLGRRRDPAGGHLRQRRYQRLARHAGRAPRFLRAYRDVIDFMYAEAKAIEAFAKYAQVSPAMAQTVRDRFYPKAMLQLDEVKGLDDMMQDAIALNTSRSR